MSPEDEVRAALDELDAAFARSDLEAVRELCTEDVLFIGSGDGEEAVGRDAIGPVFTALVERVGPIEFSLDWDSVQVEVRGDVALVAAFGHGRLKTEERDAVLRYRFTGVLVRDADRWLWRVHHGSEPGRW